MTILVLGTAGQVAQSLMAAAKLRGLDVTAVGRPTIDLLEPSSLATTFDAINPVLVVNPAAYTAVDKAESEPDLAARINGVAAGVIAELCERRGVPLIHVSTDYVFDGVEAAPYVEDDPVGPTSVYGRTKLEGERRVVAACSRPIVLRTAWIFSPYGQNFVKTMLRLAQSRPELDVVDDQWGNPTFAPHLADAILSIGARITDCNQPYRDWGLYHAAGTGETTWCRLAREVFACSERLGGPTAVVRAIPTSEYPTPARRPANSRLDCDKLRRTFNLALPPWQSGVAESVAAILERNHT